MTPVRKDILKFLSGAFFVTAGASRQFWWLLVAAIGDTALVVGV